MTKALAAAAAVLAAFPLFLILLVTASTGTPAQAAPAATGLAGTPTALARSGIPADYLAWYMAAAKTCPGLPWSALAGIGEAESGHGRSALPGVRSGSNSAGAEGPMQLEPSTFGQFAVNADPSLAAEPLPPGRARRHLHRRRHAVRPRRPRRQPGLAFARYRPPPTTTPSGTSARSRRGPPGTPTQGGSHAAATAIAFAMAQLEASQRAWLAWPAPPRVGQGVHAACLASDRLGTSAWATSMPGHPLSRCSGSPCPVWGYRHVPRLANVVM